jgi:hypothetical protein
MAREGRPRGGRVATVTGDGHRGRASRSNAQLAILALELAQTLTLGRGQPIPALAGVSLGLAHPVTQRLLVDESLDFLQDRTWFRGLRQSQPGSREHLTWSVARDWRPYRDGPGTR